MEQCNARDYIVDDGLVLWTEMRQTGFQQRLPSLMQLTLVDLTDRNSVAILRLYQKLRKNIQMKMKHQSRHQNTWRPKIAVILFPEVKLSLIKQHVEEVHVQMKFDVLLTGLICFICWKFYWHKTGKSLVRSTDLTPGT